MWPKVLAQLIELLPHVSRLVPMADRFLNSKAAAERANETALAAMAEGVRGDLGQVTAAHAGLYRKLQEQSLQLDEIGQQVRAGQQLIEQQAHKIDALEKKLGALLLWIVFGGVVLVALVITTVVLLMQMRGH